ncbi:MAG: nucleotidyltransferase domain-containing protein [Methanosarcinaceae archaeon]|nr:nucleotidyltransferase domain-containing protein [Methanosarcinaceae archaeon]
MKDIIELIKETVGRNLVSIVLFGSTARGDFDEHSDYDVLVIVKKYSEKQCKDQWHTIKKNGFKELGIPVDAIFMEEGGLNDITNPFALDVLSDGKVIFGENVLDSNVFEKYTIKPIMRGDIRVGWRIPV